MIVIIELSATSSELGSPPIQPGGRSPCDARAPEKSPPGTEFADTIGATHVLSGTLSQILQKNCLTIAVYRKRLGFNKWTNSQNMTSGICLS